MKRHAFYSLSFQNKLLLIFLPLLFCFIIITGGICLYFSGEQLKLNTEKMMENTVHQTKILLEDKLSSILMRSSAIVESTAYEYFTFSHDVRDSIDKKYLEYRSSLSGMLTDMAVEYPSMVDSIIMLEKSGDKLIYMRSPAPYVMQDTYSSLINRLDVPESQGKLCHYIWSNEHEDDLLATKKARQVLTLYCVIGNEDSTAGSLLAVNIPSATVADVLGNIVTEKGSFAALISSEGICCSEQNDGAFQLSDADMKYLSMLSGRGAKLLTDRSGSQIMISYEALDINGWVLVNGVPTDSIMKGTELVKRMIFLCVGIMIAIACIPVLLLSRWISRDISSLVDQIEIYELGDTQIYFETRDRKELRRVADALNKMTRTIQKQLGEVIYIEKSKRKTELLLLQSQINPHFLYNTLISVKSLIDLDRYQQASSMFQSLIDFYVLSLNHGHEQTSISNELKIIKNYLSILEVRYNYSFEWMINVEEDILECGILTLTLQPLVENAISHGIKNKTDKGIIDISGCCCEDQIILTVWDNGQGISPEELERLNRYIREPYPKEKTGGHFGLWNSNQRLKLYFGEAYGIEIDSEYKKYTNVTVRIPYTQTGGMHNEDTDSGRRGYYT
ncbi:sensor histidine kinase [Lachnotalea sp. AF33-28]|uniref:sensor histidine kinase n=1 Tax=Lachnotalea sp. AF33-28 TaxID=2292046 RepID=UPI000E46CF43|nr:sensor histidine kinase [Lachnotalea sp. AF33-28]RHP34063.1 sensor histidine kinase [Lachnotalea sp. AF33-28]